MCVYMCAFQWSIKDDRAAIPVRSYRLQAVGYITFPGSVREAAAINSSDLRGRLVDRRGEGVAEVK